MSLLFVVALAVISVFLAPISVKVIDRKAGWPLAVIFAVAAYFLVREAGPILDGQALT